MDRPDKRPELLRSGNRSRGALAAGCRGGRVAEFGTGVGIGSARGQANLDRSSPARPGKFATGRDPNLSLARGSPHCQHTEYSQRKTM